MILIEKTILRNALSELPSKMGFVKKSEVMKILGRQRGCDIDSITNNSIVNKLLEYENLDEQKMLVKLPYSLGKVKTLYCIDEGCRDIFELDASAIELKIMPNDKVAYTIDCTDFYWEDFGEKVFFTQEAAEAKLLEKRYPSAILLASSGEEAAEAKLLKKNERR